MGLFSKKKNTTINQTGLGDSQFDSLSAGQDSLAQGQTGINANIEAVGGELYDGQTGIMAQGQSIMDQMAQQAADAVAQAEANAQAQAEAAAAAMQQAQAAAQAAAAAAQAQTSAMNTGFGNVIDGQGNIINRVADEGITTRGYINAQNEQMNDFNNIRTKRLEDGAAENTQNILNQGETYFDEATAQRDANADQAQGDRDALKEAVLAGQVSLTDLVNQYGAAGATYFEALAQGQAGLAAGQGGLQSGLTAFQDQYTGDFANQADFLNDLIGTVAGGFDSVSAGQGQLGDQVAAGTDASVTAAAAAAEGVTAAVADSSNGQPSVDYARIARDITTGNEQITDEMRAQQGQWTGRLDTMRNLLITQGDDLDAATKTDYTQLVNAFDQQGKLISESIDEQGVRTARAIDENGNLLISQFDATGARIMENNLNINALLSGLESRMSFAAGANYSMGNKSPTYNRRYGIMSPYSQTAR